MKRLIKIPLLIFLLLIVSGVASATPLPWLDFGFKFQWDGAQTYTDNGTTRVHEVTYQDGSTSDAWTTPTDPVIGSLVNLDITMDGDDTNDKLVIAGFLTADIVLLGDFDPVAQIPNPYQAGLTNIAAIGVGSRWLDEFMDSVDATKDIEAQLILSFSATHANPDGTYTINGSGKTAPVPEPATMLLLGTGLIGLAGIGRKKADKLS